MNGRYATVALDLQPKGTAFSPSPAKPHFFAKIHSDYPLPGFSRSPSTRSDVFGGHYHVIEPHRHITGDFFVGGVETEADAVWFEMGDFAKA